MSAEGEPISGAQVVLGWSKVDNGVRSRSIRRTVSDGTGYFLFTQLGAGVHTVNVSAYGYRGTRVDYTVGASDSDIEVELQRTSVQAP